MSRFLKGPGFKIFAVVIAALIAGSIISAAFRSGSSPLTAITSTIFAPATRLAGALSSGLSNLPISFKSSSSLKEQIDTLQDEVDSLKEQLVDYEQVIHKNEFYKEFLNLKEEHTDYVFAEAAIIGRDSSDRFSTFTLNRGSTSDIEINDPVIYGKYLVGVVTSLTPTQCTVSTILNPNVNVSAYEVRTRELGYVTSTVALSEEGMCHMPGLAAQTAITAGGMVCTSGVGGIYPRDLIIGTVTDIIDTTLDISACAIIKPGVDFSQITDVFIITDFNNTIKE